MLMKGLACFMFLNREGEVGPSISSSVVLRSFVLLVYIVVLVLVLCLCPSSVRVVATLSGTVSCYYVLCPRFFLILNEYIHSLKSLPNDSNIFHH